MKEIIERFFKGEGYDSYKYFGAHPYKDGYVFRVFAPNATKVLVVGDFNKWDGKKHVMNKVDDRGIYELYIEEIKDDYTLYRYKIKTKSNRYVEKSDPYAFFSEMRPNTASKTYNLESYEFKDAKWMAKRSKCYDKPLSIFELHVGSFIKHADDTWYSYDELASELVKYCKKHHFTHVEFLPLMEHPFDGSWGYQVSQYYSITSRYGNPSQLRYLIDTLHNNNIGVIIDFVPTHFVKDATALAMFDGGPVYESDHKELRESQWDTYLFDFSKPQVMSYLTGCANFYLEEYHFDGIRFDAISNMIYRDGNMNNGEQAPNINWMKKSNDILARNFPEVMLIAEDSSSFGKVTKPTFEGGLGFDYKWDLGWMNDTLKYLKIDPYFRGDHLNLINFSMFYFFSERFLLPFSHDEVVHMKGSIINKISGSYEQKFQQLKVLYTYMFTHPGKKLNFMGNELAVFDEWIENRVFNQDILRYPIHDAFNKYFAELNRLYTTLKPLYINEYFPLAFNFIQCDNKDNVFIYERNYNRSSILVVLNFSSNQFDHYRFKVSKKKGYYQEILNSDDYQYNGYGCVNNYNIQIDENKEIGIRIPTFGAIILKYKTR